MKHPNKAVMALGDRVWAVAEGVEGRGAAGGSVDRQASPGRRIGIGKPPKRGAHGSRLRADEKALEHFGTSIIASESTMTLTGASFAWRELDMVRVKGRAKPVRIYEPLAIAGEETADQIARTANYCDGLARWRAGDFASAASLFARFAETDPPSALFMNRAHEKALAPPPEYWEPTYTLG